MSVIARRFAASPKRTASLTWDAIVNVIASQSASVKSKLNTITGIVSPIIADETLASNAITVIGTGSRLRIYCLYGEDAISDEANEGKLSWNLFSTDDWEIHFPVEEEDFSWTTQLLKEKDKRFKTYKAGEKLSEYESDQEEQRNESQSVGLTINLEKFKANG